MARQHAIGDGDTGMYMPTVGANFASAIALGAFGYSHWGYVFFGAGFLSWMSLEATYLYHLRSSEPLHPEQRPLLGIQLAPAFVGSSAYLSCNGGQIDMVVLGLIGYGLLNLFFMVRLMTWVLRLGLSCAALDDSFTLLGHLFVILGTTVIALLIGETLLLVITSRKKKSRIA